MTRAFQLLGIDLEGNNMRDVSIWLNAGWKIEVPLGVLTVPLEDVVIAQKFGRMPSMAKLQMVLMSASTKNKKAMAVLEEYRAQFRQATDADASPAGEEGEPILDA